MPWASVCRSLSIVFLSIRVLAHPQISLLSTLYFSAISLISLCKNGTDLVFFYFYFSCYTMGGLVNLCDFTVVSGFLGIVEPRSSLEVETERLWCGFELWWVEELRDVAECLWFERGISMFIEAPAPREPLRLSDFREAELFRIFGRMGVGGWLISWSRFWSKVTEGS